MSHCLEINHSPIRKIPKKVKSCPICSQRVVRSSSLCNCGYNFNNNNIIKTINHSLPNLHSPPHYRTINSTTATLISSSPTSASLMKQQNGKKGNEKEVVISRRQNGKKKKKEEKQPVQCSRKKRKQQQISSSDKDLPSTTTMTASTTPKKARKRTLDSTPQEECDDMKQTISWASLLVPKRRASRKADHYLSGVATRISKGNEGKWDDEKVNGDSEDNFQLFHDHFLRCGWGYTIFSITEFINFLHCQQLSYRKKKQDDERASKECATEENKQEDEGTSKECETEEKK